MALRYAAFTDRPGGGNPAGVVLDAAGMSDEEMLGVAARLGYSETAFLRSEGEREYGLRFFSPVAEVPFCGHATIAAGVALGERTGPGEIVFHTPPGEVVLRTDGESAGFMSVAAHAEEADAGDLDAALAALRWKREDLDPALPPRIGFAGARHLIVAVSERERLARLDYDFDALRDLMLGMELTTVHLVWRETDARYHARDPFPVGGVVEDPATGAAAAAFGAYLRELGVLSAPARFTILQGEDMGRPSELAVELERGRDGIRVSGRAVPLD